MIASFCVLDYSVFSTISISLNRNSTGCQYTDDSDMRTAWCVINDHHTKLANQLHLCCACSVLLIAS